MKHLIYYIKKFLINILIILITIYQNTISLILPSTCRFAPSCSNYMILSLKKYGIKSGIWLGIKRILRCHPFSTSNGWDPV